MFEVEVESALLNVAEEPFNCDNCKASILPSQYYVSQVLNSNLTKYNIFDAICEIYKLKDQSEPPIINEVIKLCSSCGIRMTIFYKGFEQFAQLTHADTKVSNLLRGVMRYSSKEKVNDGNNSQECVLQTTHEEESPGSQTIQSAVDNEGNLVESPIESKNTDDNRSNLDSVLATNIPELTLKEEYCPINEFLIEGEEKPDLYHLSRKFKILPGIPVNHQPPFNISGDGLKEETAEPMIVLNESDEAKMECQPLEIFGLGKEVDDSESEHDFDFESNSNDNSNSTKISNRTDNNSSTSSTHLVYDKRGYPCHICEDRHLTLRLLRVHYSKVHKLQYNAALLHCKEAFQRKQTEVARSRGRNGDIKIACDLCKEVFFCDDMLEKHKLSAHSGANPNTCTECGKTFSKRYYLKYHVYAIHLKVKVFQCTECDKGFSTKGSLDMHKVVHLNTPEEVKKTELCSICGKAFAHYKYLRVHERQMHIRKRQKHHKCERCGKTFAKGFDLREHILTHEDKRDFICDLCGKAFNTKQNLSRHQKYHKEVEEKPHHCSRCGRNFPTKHSLKSHLVSKAHNLRMEEAKAEAGISSVTKDTD